MNTYFDTSSSRTAGSMPVWKPSPAEKSDDAQVKPTESYGFKDIIDVINPLQHIPIINTAYQKITGDTIKPAAQILGGGLFGGPLGAGGAAINVAVETQTGKNISGHAFAAFTKKNAQKDVQPEILQTPPQSRESDHPEDNINRALAQLAEMDAMSAIAFTDLSHHEYERYETKPVAQGRTAGHDTNVFPDLTAPHHNDKNTYRQPITEQSLSPMPEDFAF